MEQLTFFHDHTLFILLIITVIVGYLLGTLYFNRYTNRFLLEGQTIEVIWTIIPAVTLVFIALPSLRLLYLLDEVNQPCLILKVVGHQWYWSRNLLSSKMLNRPCKILLYKTSISPVAMHGYETWPLTKHDVESLLRFERKILRAQSLDQLSTWRRTLDT